MMTKLDMNTNPSDGLLAHESLLDDYTWRFQLIRTTIEDLDRLDADGKSLGATNRRSSLHSPTMARDVPLPSLTLARLRLAAMSA